MDKSDSRLQPPRVTGSDPSVGESPLEKEPRRSFWTNRLRRLVWYAVSVVLGIAGWWIAALADGSATEGLLPTPGAVGKEAVAGFSEGWLLDNIIASLLRVLAGFFLGVVLAVPVGFLMGWFLWARGLIEPWVQFFRTIPPLALIPLVILFLGIGETAKVFLIFLASFLATVIATFGGVRSVDKTLIDAARVLGANSFSVFLRVVVPAAFPYILVGARIGLGSSWATLVASELIAANEGLGRMMQRASQYYDVPTIMVGIVSIGVLGFVMDRGLLILEERLTRWQETREA